MQQVEPYRLATLPQILLELQDELQNSARTYASVSNIIRKDPSLLVRVIAVAASNKNAPLNSLELLCADLGFESLQSIAYSSATYQAFRNYQNDQIMYFERFWCRAFFAAQIALSLAKITNYRDPEEAYLCTLVRGIGQLAMEAQSNGLISKKLAADASVSNCLLYEVEQFGVNHYLLSAQLVDDWGVTPNFSDAIKYQAKSITAIRDAHHLVKIVNIASQAVDKDSEGTEQFAINVNTLFATDLATSKAIFDRARDQAVLEANRYGVDSRDFIPADSAIDIPQQVHKLDLESRHHFREKHQQLRAQVRDISLVSSACNTENPPQDEEELLSLVKNALRLLLSTNSSVFFLYGQHTDTLQVAPNEDIPDFLKEIRIPVEQGRSILSNALLEGLPNRFLPEDADQLEAAAVVDRQFLNFLGTSGCYCYPLCFDEKPLGVLLIGVEQRHVDAISDNTQLIQMLMSRLGSLLKEFYWVRDSEHEVVNNQVKTYEMSVRKAIHEANNPLSAIQNYLEIMGAKLEDNPSAKENLLIVKSEISRVCEILSQLGQQSVAGEPLSSYVNLNQVVADQVKLFETSSTSAQQIETVLELDEEIPNIWGSENGLKQILTNLILNSIEAMPTGGTVSVSTADQFYLNDVCYVEISISDTGTGIDAALMPRLFEVKRSLKGKKHAGVGLNIVQNLVADMNGMITCRNSKQGVTWQILLPRKTDQ